MLTYLASSIWESPAQTLVNTVNTVGVMGKGIALEFKKLYPEMYVRYKELCNGKKLDVGMLWLYRAENRYILNFPTKKHWRHPSKLEYIEIGLEKFVESYERFNITSISFPQLGTGNGGLDWEGAVRPLMQKYLRTLPIPVYIHIQPHNPNFVPEHYQPINHAIPFETLLDDLRGLIGMELKTPTKENRFKFLDITDQYLCFLRGGAKVTVPIEHLRMLWDDLHFYRILQSGRTPGRISKEQGLIFGLLSKIPYIHMVEASEQYSNLVNQHQDPPKALMLTRRMKEEAPEQLTLWK